MFDLKEELARRLPEKETLFAQHVNPRLAKVLNIIDFSHPYVRGEGCYLYDAEGNDYLDLLAGYGVFSIGRSHPKLVKTLHDYLDIQYPSLVQMDGALLAGMLAEKLVMLSPDGLDNVFFTNSGTEGVETALKFARCATGKSRVIYNSMDFHGLTLGALSVNGSNAFTDGFHPLLPDTEPIPFGDLDALREKLKAKDVAAYICEPVQGKTVTVAPEGFLREAAELCRRYKAVFIVDEVMTGIGRTGKLFACQWEDVSPDILITAKALSGGFVPVGAVLAKKWIYDNVFSSLERCVVHSNTFGRGGMAMACGLQVLDIMEEEKIIENAEKTGAMLTGGLLELQKTYPMIKEVRGRGLMIAIELKPPKSLWGRLSGAFMNTLSAGLLAQAFVVPLMSNHRILTQVGGHGADVIRLLPPLVLGDAEVKRFLTAFTEILQAAEKFPGPVWEIGSRLAKLSLRRKPKAGTDN